MKKLIYLLSAVAVSLSVLACSNGSAKNSKVDPNSILFVKNGIESGLTEIKASGMAITNSNNQKVIAFAKMLIDDHTKANDDLKKLESDKKIDETDTISLAHNMVLNELSKKSGTVFDKAYLQLVAVYHEQTIKLFTTGTKDTDPDIAKFAAATLPTLKMHLDSANAICVALK
jgi:putative membrane protein